MKQLPHEVQRMGATLRAEVEKQLMLDLAHYGISGPDLRIDWSKACQEGHCTTYLGGTLEELSGVAVRDRNMLAVAEGWLDFVHGGEDNPLFVFWLFLSVISGTTRREVKADVGIPEHIWQRLPDSTKLLCSRGGEYDSRWAKDPKVRAWLRGHAT